MCRSQNCNRFFKPSALKTQAIFDTGEGEGQAEPQAERSVYVLLYDVAKSLAEDCYFQKDRRIPKAQAIDL